MIADRKIVLKFSGEATALNRTVKDVEASISRLSKAATGIGIRTTGNDNFLKDEIRAQRDLLGLQVAVQQAKKASLATIREEIRLESEKNRLASQTTTGRKQTAATGDPAMRAALADIRRYQQSSAKMEKDLTRQVEREAEAQFRARTNQYQRGLKEFERVLAKQKEAEKQAAPGKSDGFGRDLFSTVFGASTAAGLAVNVIGGVVSGVKELASEAIGLGVQSVKLAAEFQDTTNALTVFSGSTRLAKEEIAAIDEVSRNTVGLRMQTAEEGYTRLRALGFAAENSRNLVVGLAKEKLISNASEQDVNRVIVNLTQLSAGSSRASQDIKEIIHAMPSMRAAFEDAFGTADPKKLKAFIDSDPDKAFEKLAAAMAKVQSPAGGLNDALGKTQDALIEAGREFGEPIVQPLTDALKEVTTILRSGKSDWASWGGYIGDIIRGLTGDLKDLNNNTGKPAVPMYKDGNGDLVPDKGFWGNSAATWVKGSGQILNFLMDHSSTGGLAKELSGSNAAERGAQIRRAEEEKNKPKTGLFSQTNDNTFFGLSQKQWLDNIAENEKATEAFNKRKERADTIAKAKELQTLQDGAKESETILKNRFEVEQAIRDSTVRYTTEQEKAFALTNGQAKSRNLQSEIARQTGLFNKEIALQSGKDDEIAKLTKDKNIKLSELNKEYQINEITTQKQVKEFERKILEERRAALIDFKQFAISESKFSLDNKTFDVSRSIEQGVANAAQGFDELKNLSRNSYEEISRLTQESFALQLQNQSLSVEQRSNLVKQGYFEQQKLAEENRRAIIDIEEKQYQAQISNLQSQSQRTQAIFSANASLLGSASGLLGENITKATVSKYQDIFVGRKQNDNYNNAQYAREKAIRDYQQNNNQTQMVAQNQNGEVLTKGFEGFNADVNKAKTELDEFNKSVTGGEKLIGFLANSLTRTSGSFKALDQIAQISLFEKQRNELDAFNAELKLNRELLKLAGSKYEKDLTDSIRGAQKYLTANPQAVGSNDVEFQVATNTVAEAQKALQEFWKTGEATSKEALELSNKVSVLNLGLKGLFSNQEQEKAELYAKSLAGLNARFEELLAKDPTRMKVIQDAIEKDVSRERGDTLTNIYRLESKYYEDSTLLALRRKETLLNANREIYEAEQNSILSQIESQVKLAHQTDISFNQISAKVKEHLASQISYNEAISNGIISIYDSAASGIDKLLDKSGIGKIPILGDIAKAQSRNVLSKITTGLLDSILPPEIANAFKEGSDNPLVKQQIETNQHLKIIQKSLTSPIGGGIGGSSAGGTSAGGSLNIGSVVGALTGGGLGFGKRTGDVVDGASQVFSGDKGRQDFLSNIKYLFSSKDGGLLGKGGIFGKDGFGFNGGTGSAIGTGVAAVGGLIGGRAGHVLSYAGQGAAIGGQFGGIYGAAIGAGVGLWTGLLTMNRQRNKEEKLRTQFLQDGINGLSGFDTIIQAVRSLHLDPASGLLQGKTLGDSLHASYIQQANTLKDKKTRNIALKSVSELDFRIREKMDLLEAVAKKSASVKDLEGHIVGEFAQGNYFGGGRDNQMRDMRRNLDMRRGYINGGQLGVDRHLGLFADGEIIANLDHQRRIIEAAGFDVFASAGIPNYPSKPQPIKGYAEGNYFSGSAPTISSGSTSPGGEKQTVVNNFTVVLEGVTFNEGARAFIESDNGQKTVAKIVEKKYANSELRLQKR